MKSKIKQQLSNIDPQVLQGEIKDRIRGFYPYFLGFYLLSLAVSIFSRIWSAFFYWPGFHLAITYFTLLFVLTFKIKFKLDRQLRITGLVKQSVADAWLEFRRYLGLVCARLARVTGRTWLKLILLVAGLVMAILHGIEVVDFLTLAYALVSILFILDSHWSAGLALVLLAACPVLLMFKSEILAENIAVFAYYFLVITVLTQLRELKKEGLTAEK